MESLPPLETLALETREGLPEALRVLLTEHPREAWEADPGFHGLVAFWLERHMMFRKLAGLLTEDVEKALDAEADPLRYAARLSRYGSMLVGELHGHHNIEDMHYFPLLSQRESRIEAGFELLEMDHQALDPLLASFAETANGAIRAAEAGNGFRDALGGFESELRRLDRLLHRHLADEEELVVPVILKHGTQGLG